MARKVFQRLRDRGRVGVRDRFICHVIGSDCADQRHRLRRAERQIKAMHTSISEPATRRAVGRFTTDQPPLHGVGVGLSTRSIEVRQSDQFGRAAGVTGAQPNGCAGVVFGVVLPQPAAGLLSVYRGAGGVVVVVDRPGRQFGNRQHVDHRLGPRSPGAQSHRVANATFATANLAHPCANVP